MVTGRTMFHTTIDAIELALKEQGEPQSPYWLASQMGDQSTNR